jgi:hypothetical protein
MNRAAMQSGMVALLVFIAGSSGRAAGLDRDGILAEAPAAPDPGTVRLSGVGGGQSQQAPGATSQGLITGSLLWAPYARFAADAGYYYQAGTSGPSVRARYQLLGQDTQGIDLALGARWKSVGFFKQAGELESLLALGRNFGRLETILNVVWGFELDGPGMDAEVKAIIGWRFTDAFRLGVDFRLQGEVHDENGFKWPGATGFDLITGGSASWLPVPKFQIQSLLGVTKPRGLAVAGAVGLVAAAVDL